MSKYTTQLRYICETESGLDESVGYKQIANVIEGARSKIFDFPYPIFDEAYRPVLETKIIKHYYTREIGTDAYGLWKLWLDTRMNEIMPYYNQMYKSELLEFNPFYDVDMTKDRTGTRTGEKTETGESTGKTVGTNERTGNGSVNETTSNTESANGRTSNSETTTGSTSKTEKITGKTDSSEINEGTGNSSEIVDGVVITTGEGTGNSNRLDAYSDTPQGGVSNLKDYTYLTNARDVTDNNTYESEDKVDNDTTTTVTSSNKNTVTGERNSENNVTGSRTSEGTLIGEATSENSLNGSSEKNGNNSFTEESSSTVDVTGTTSGNTTMSDTEAYIEHITGKNGGASYSKLLNEFRTTFMNIDMLIIEELSDLFMNLW